MFNRNYINVEKLWHIYIIHADNHGKKPNRYIKWTNIYYTGITCRGIGKRYGDYLYKRGCGYLNSIWRGASKRLVYVEYCYGTEFEAMKREKQIKRMGVKQKQELIRSKNNRLISVSMRNGLNKFVILFSQQPYVIPYVSLIE